MRIRKCIQNNQRKRTLHRNKVRLANRRHMQFTQEQCEHIALSHESELVRH